MTVFDVAVIGAGPAGAIAATLLARQGKRVVVVDPGQKAAERIGETLPGFAAEILHRHGLPGPLSDGRHKSIGGTVSMWGGVRTVESALMRPGGHDWRLDRAAFDAGLQNAAVLAGAEIQYAKVEFVEPSVDVWTLSIGCERHLSAGFVIDASGRRGIVSRRLGGPLRQQSKQVAIWAIGQPPTVNKKPTSRTLIEDQGKGWWYGAMLPSGRPIAAYHCSVDRAVGIRKEPYLWQRNFGQTVILIDNFGAASFKNAELHFTDASGVACQLPAGSGWASCGDAAMAFDPLASQGLLNAIRTGIAAADIAAGKKSVTAYCSEMDSVWRHYVKRHAMMTARRSAAMTT